MKNKVFIFIFAMLAISQISFGQSQGSSTLTFDQDYLTYAIDNGNAIVTSCFSDATGEITIPEMVSFKRKKYPVTGIGENAFKRNKKLISVSIPNSVTDIGSSAFSLCTGLKTITLSNSLINIGDNAFSGCRYLTSITIPSTVVSIGERSFANCTSLSSIVIPKSVTNISNQAFDNCSGLVSIVVESGNGVYDSRNNCNAIIHTATNELIRGCQNTVIPDNIKSIGSYAFYKCKNLKSVEVPKSVTSIGDYAFYECTSLTSINFPDGVNAVFRGNIKSIGSYAFYMCKNLTSVNIPKPVTSIGNYAFGECSGLSSIIIPNSVVNIGDGAFKNCKGIDNIFVPNSVAKIGNGAFEGVSCISYDGALRGTPWGAQRMGIVDKSKIKTIEDYLYYNNIKATLTPSGLYIIVNKKGQSRNTVSSGCGVTADYIMRQLDGTIIDCSDENLAKQSLTYNSTRYYEPLRYTAGTGQSVIMIKGWEEGIMGQTEGSVITLIVPSNLAYGEKGLEPHIAPNTPLIIEITIRIVSCPRLRW